MTTPEKDAAAEAAGLRRTPLCELHRDDGATFGEVAGWEMPLWYPAGAVKEHRAVVQAAGIFDTSHMTTMLVEGPGAATFMDYAFTRELAEARPGRAVYGAFLDDKGGVVDDAIVYPFEPGRLGVVANAGKAKTLAAHLRGLPGGAAFDYRDLSGGLVKIDLQGPRCVAVLRGLADDPERVFGRFPFFAFQGDFAADTPASTVTLLDGVPALLSRTGYTGEAGFEIFVPRAEGAALWRRLLADGADAGLIACGYAARDSLRAGAVLPLSGHDIGRWPFINHPWTAALPFDAEGRFTKLFHGMEALIAAQPTAGHTLPFVGYDPRKVDIAAARVELAGEGDSGDGAGPIVGRVLTAVADMAIGRVDGLVVGLNSPGRPEGWQPRGLVCGFVLVDRDLPAGSRIRLRDDRRALDAEIVRDIRPARTARLSLDTLARWENP